MSDLFPESRLRLPLDPGAVLLGGYALRQATDLLDAITSIAAAAPFRRMETPGGRRMSVAMTSAGAAGWISDRRGYRYSANDPETGQPWPNMPPLFLELARRAAAEAGFPGFDPDSCLINRYEPGTRMAPHQDRDEAKMDQPIVSVSLGLTARFLWGGPTRSDRARRLPLLHGDVLVWGGPARLFFHGVDALSREDHPCTHGFRYNLTLRRALM